ncbi:MAG TPA: hypothetical protein VGX68_08680 [Thermoanaerobaculia bacterium]|jgi:hypothetical protein|nr:hypothetical protein [Thermoanaerobaculia bacterium]
MLLPGGIVRDGERRRHFAFRPVDGALETALAEAVSAPSMPAAVTAALAAALAEVGGEPSSPEVVRELAVGDRQFLVRQLSAHLGRDRVWLTAVCQACGERFDFEVPQTELPVKEAGAGYPYAEAGTPRARLRLRVPTGADQEAVADLPDDRAVRALFERCLLSGVAAEDEDLAAAEAALEAAAPEVALAALAACPACGAQSEIAVDPYLVLAASPEELFVEVHRLASSYHWSEAEILALPRARRQLYLRLIDRSRGLVQ